MSQATGRKFIIATHGRMASGIKSSLEMIIGQTEGLFLIEAYIEGNKGIEEELERVLSNIDTQAELIVFTDLLGGSITNQVLRLTHGRNIHIVSGFNLAMLIETIMADPSEPIDEIVESAIIAAREQLVYVNKLMNSNEEPDTND
jgi:fructoselysine and glucoselysine-specific PTS system IIA component